MPILQVRIDEDLKNQASKVFEDIGLDISTAVRMFLKKSILVGGLPFDTQINEEALLTKIKALIALDEMRSISEKNGNSTMTLDEINKIINQVRTEQKGGR